MTATHNVVLRGGVADGETLHWDDIGAPIEWEDVGGGATTYVFADSQEAVAGTDLVVYRIAGEPARS